MEAQVTEEQKNAEHGGVGEQKAKRGSGADTASTLGRGWEAILKGSSAMKVLA